MWCESIESARRAIPDQLEWFTALKDVALRTFAEVEHGIFIAEGEVVIRRAAAAGYRLVAVLAESKWVTALGDLLAADLDVIIGTPSELEQITGYHVHRGALAAFQRRTLPDVDPLMATSRRTVFIEGMVNHTNVGSIFRSAAAMRIDAIVIDPHCADPLYRRAIRTSMGTVFQVPWTRATLTQMRALEDCKLIALTPDPDAIDIRDVDWNGSDRVVLMVGTEGEGLSRQALDLADVSVTIPMAAGVDSLNAAAATAVACHEMSRALR